MFNKFSIGKSATDFEDSDQLAGYSKVVIEVTDEISYESGSDTGRTLTMSCPWGTQQMANDILTSIRGYQYQPYTAQGAVIDPSVEVGDAIQVNGVHGGVYDTSISFGSEPRFDVSAPHDEEVDESAPYKSSTDRKINRQKFEMNAQFAIQAGLISAKVSKTGGESSSFGWELDEKSWMLKSNGAIVLTADKNGLEVKGTIHATGGEIGGFTIERDHLSYNGQTWGGTNTIGAYLGTSGLQLGKNFKVDMQGNLNANSGTFAGTVHAGNIDYGGDAGYFSGGGLSGGSVYGTKIASSTLGTSKFTGGVNTSLANANYSFDAVANGAEVVNVGAYMFYLGGSAVRKATTTIDGRQIHYLSWDNRG